ncbi:MAG TPA: M23 family metallopeptidase [Geminicoccaceae bacterium]|nr:M23 family metallopeptidase [Geminicoccaceae bacterium]
MTAIRARSLPWIVVFAATLLPAAAAAAAGLRLEGDLSQGGLVRGEVPPGAAVALDGRALRVSPEGRFVLGFDRDAGPEAELAVRLPDGRTEARRLAVAPRTYDVQRIDGLPPRRVEPRSEADLARIRAEAALIAAARRRDTAGPPGLAGGFAWPVTGIITGVYGSQRVLNGRPRAPHRGVDIAAPTGTPVRAMADGVASLARPDLFFTGHTVVIDHGHGLGSVYAHLDSLRVEEGQAVARGEVIGTVGATGRATGPHLHWGVYWFDRALDPARLVGPMPEPEAEGPGAGAGAGADGG